ncbi:GNAT family N-acetyltransferase [Endozoicomonas ascidiicola]|uniref:GNAT family N-acetyltransferase n=1 Tax=Endozoicomonas ascidiicola TaxID=1698521 RepID=UPI0008376F9F|nr:N-acetyltransferase [Endozoicomonas ascidiicola]
MKIRASLSEDSAAIYELHRNTFDESEAETVAKLACSLLEDASAQPLLSLVAEQDDRIVGHTLFSHVVINEAPSIKAAILAPLGVSTDVQKQGVGTRLIQDGLQILKEHDVVLVFVYGDPGYYGRSGFSLCSDISAPYTLEHPHGWQVQELKEGVLSSTKGTLRCADALMSPDLW